MNEYFLTKDIGKEAIKDIDAVKGIITGYFSIFGNKDSDGDIVMPGAYKKTLKENGPDSEKPRILHLYMHDATKVLGKPNVLKEDKKGLYFESQISQTALGKDVIQLYVDKVLTEHSIGYQIVKRERDEERDEQKLIELKLWEGSTVSWGANMEAIVDSVKDGLPNKAILDKLFEKLTTLETAVKGSYTDDTARQLEIYLKQIQQIIFSLVRKSQEPDKSTQEPEKPKVDADWIMQKLNINI